MFDNPPRLAPEVLQQLLSEAYNPLSKQLSTLKEEDCEGKRVGIGVGWGGLWFVSVRVWASWEEGFLYHQF